MIHLTPAERTKLIAQGLIKMPDASALPGVTADKRRQLKAVTFELKKTEGEIRVLTAAANILRQPKFILAPAEPTPKAPSANPRRTKSECLRLNICCQCRESPAIYYGPVGGFGRNCEPCAEVIRAKARERSARK
jgi:hypothetical protein